MSLVRPKLLSSMMNRDTCARRRARSSSEGCFEDEATGESLGIVVRAVGGVVDDDDDDAGAVGDVTGGLVVGKEFVIDVVVGGVFD